MIGRRQGERRGDREERAESEKETRTIMNGSKGEEDREAMRGGDERTRCVCLDAPVRLSSSSFSSSSSSSPFPCLLASSSLGASVPSRFLPTLAPLRGSLSPGCSFPPGARC